MSDSMLEVKLLDSGEINNIHRTFIEAFSDYAVPIQMEKERLERMIKRRGTLFERSVGVFDKEKMVAVMMVAVDTFLGKKSAYDVFTGVIPDYRGKKLAGKMFDFVKPYLISDGVQQFILEVLQENTPAVKVYEKTGFKIRRSFDCYEVKAVECDDNHSFSCEVIDNIKENDFPDKRDWLPSWQNSNKSILRTVEKIVMIKVLSEDQAAGYLVFVPESGDLPQLFVDPSFREQGVGKLLLDKALKMLPDDGSLRIINIDSDSISDKAFFSAIKAEVITTQFEMVLDMEG